MKAGLSPVEEACRILSWRWQPGQGQVDGPERQEVVRVPGCGGELDVLVRLDGKSAL